MSKPRKQKTHYAIEKIYEDGSLTYTALVKGSYDAITNWCNARHLVRDIVPLKVYNKWYRRQHSDLFTLIRG